MTSVAEALSIICTALSGLGLSRVGPSGLRGMAQATPFPFRRNAKCVVVQEEP
jgi:hypothetical protein